MKRLSIAFFILMVPLFHHQASAQTVTEFDFQAYQNFLNANQDLSFTGINELYPVAEAAEEAPVVFDHVLYADSIRRYYALNAGEMDLLEKHGFMVTDRIRYKSFGEALFTIYKRDLPVYISSDAILHALHMSYSEMLINLETQLQLPAFTGLLKGLHAELGALISRYDADPDLTENLMDVDLYLSIPLILLEEPAEPYFTENIAEIDKLMAMIGREGMESYPLFSDVHRLIDFSQFIPRGHYTQSPDLTRYFRAMMWMGRTEFYLIVPDAQPYSSMSQEERDLIGQRQTIASYLLTEAFEGDGNRQALDDMDQLLMFLVGESDNVTLDHLDELRQETGFADASGLADLDVYRAFRDVLETKPWAGQRILSQILKTDPMSPNDIEPASAFLPLGQRFIIDSFVMGNLVYDKVSSPNRMLPKSADVLFALGNNDALPVLQDELDHYNYAPNLAALRYLVDSYGPEYWDTSFFNLWLNAIRQLNPPEDRSPLPPFMQTGAWANKTMTTQLASWAQLRHDNLLYAKQSYSGGPVCSYPQSYVEPVPHFFGAIVHLAREAKRNMNDIRIIEGWPLNWMTGYFNRLETIAARLETIAGKQLAGVDTSPEEKEFLQGMLHESQMCGVELTGWYKDLYITGDVGALKEDFIVADVHTSPFDEMGNQVGWVMHVGTGPLNLAVLTATLGDGQTYAFVGPVMSFYEHVSVNFKRLTDEEWVTTFEEEPSMRPEFVNSYLSTAGEPYYDDRTRVISSIGDDPTDVPNRIELQQNYPNPFNAGTIIPFTIPSAMGQKPVELTIYNVQGQVVETLIQQPMPAGNYTVRWGGTAASGTYFYRLNVDGQVQSRKMILIK
jgi:hypothetical protein